MSTCAFIFILSLKLKKQCVQVNGGLGAAYVSSVCPREQVSVAVALACDAGDPSCLMHYPVEPGLVGKCGIMKMPRAPFARRKAHSADMIGHGG